MTEPAKAYAVSYGEYSDYSVIAIFRRKEDAETFAANADPKEYSYYQPFVEEFDYYEGEAAPTPVRGSTSGSNLSESTGPVEHPSGSTEPNGT